MKPTPRTAERANVYEPFEDSFFLLDCLEQEEPFLTARFRAPLVAEIGCGSGVVTAFVASLVRAAQLASDINPAACASTVDTWRQNQPPGRLDVARGDLLEFLRPALVDVLIFNPPYVPTERVPVDRGLGDSDDGWVDFALDGGVDGMEVTSRVLERLDAYLSAEGVAYILFCANNHPERLVEGMRAHGFASAKIAERRAGRELLSVYRYSRV